MVCKVAFSTERLFKHCTINHLTATTGIRNFKKYQIVHVLNGWIQPQLVPLSPHVDIPFIDGLLTLNILLYGIEISDGIIKGELTKRSMRKQENKVRLLRFNNHVCHVSKINPAFRSEYCFNCDTFFNRIFNLEQQFYAYSKVDEKVHPRNICQIREIVFDKLDSFEIRYTSQQKEIQKFSDF